MAIKRAKANFHNGTDFDTFHYETQVKQVKLLDASGNVVKDLEQELTDIKNSVSAVDDRVDEINQTIDDFKSEVGSVDTLQTTAKTIVPAINEVKTGVENNAQNIVSTNVNLDDLREDFNNHNHDSVYLKQSGGNLTGEVSLNNNVSLSGKNTDGTKVNLAKVDANNVTVLGNKNNKTLIYASNGDVSISNGTTSYKLFHNGNMGHGSKLDADTIDGIEGSQIARQDAYNHFTVDQFIDKGKSLYIQADSGSKQAGSLFFRDSNGTQMGRIKPTTNGDIEIYGNSIKGLTIKGNGGTETYYDHILNARDRQVAVRFKLDDGDAGAGFYMNQASKQLGMYDWEHGSWYFTTDRHDQMVKFYNPIMIKGHQFTIDWTAPANPKEGDVWIDINS